MPAGPLGAVRVAKLGTGEWVFNPSLRQQKGAALSLLYAGTRDACTRLELQVWQPVAPKAFILPYARFIRASRPGSGIRLSWCAALTSIAALWRVLACRIMPCRGKLPQRRMWQSRWTRRRRECLPSWSSSRGRTRRPQQPSATCPPFYLTLQHSTISPGAVLS